METFWEVLNNSSTFFKMMLHDNNIPFFFLSLILGFKHAYDSDHIVAVATYLPKSKSMKETFKMSISWALGHMLTAAIVTLILFIYKDLFLTQILAYFEIIVGGMLILLGFAGIISAMGIEFFHSQEHHDHDEDGHLHAHLHDEGKIHTHYHKHMFGIGIVHGLASNDELIVLFTASLGVASLAGLISYVAIYTLGVVAGMIVFGFALSYPIIKADQEQITKAALILFGIVSILYGLFIVFERVLI